MPSKRPSSRAKKTPPTCNPTSTHVSASASAPTSYEAPQTRSTAQPRAPPKRKQDRDLSDESEVSSDSDESVRSTLRRSKRKKNKQVPRELESSSDSQSEAESKAQSTGREDEPKQDDHKTTLHIGFDLATSHSGASWNFAPEGQGLNHRNAVQSNRVVGLSCGSSRIPSEAVILPDEKKTNGNDLKLVFGDEIKEALIQHKIAPHEVLRNIKLCLASDEPKKFDQKQRNMLNDLKASQEKAISPYLTKKVNVYSCFTGQVSEVTINNVADVLIQFLRYLLDLVKLDYKDDTGILSYDDIENTFQQARVGISCPVSWDDMMIDDLGSMLESANYPSETIITSEAMTIALVRLIESIQNTAKAGFDLSNFRNSALVVCDVGHGTTDLASVKIDQLEPFIRLSEIVPGAGSLSGSEWLTVVATRYIMANKKAELDQMWPNRNPAAEETLIGSLSRGFEAAKPILDPQQPANTIVYTVEHSSGTAGRKLSQETLELSGHDVEEILKEWTNAISQLVADLVKRTREASPNLEFMEIHLAGGGAHSKVLQNKIRGEHAGPKTAVTVSKPKNFSAVAQGNLWSILDEEHLCRPKYARVSYGTALEIEYDPENPNHVQAKLNGSYQIPDDDSKGTIMPDCLVWAICMRDPIDRQFIGGHITATDHWAKFDKITLRQPVLWSNKEDVCLMSESYNAETELKRGTVNKGGELSMEVGSAIDAGFEVVKEGPINKITVEFRAEIQHRGLLPKWVFTVPKGGTWKRSEELFNGGVFREIKSLKNMRKVEAQETMKDVEMTG